MKIKGLYPESFGKFRDREITFSPGLNLIYGANEAGKSTLFAFMKGMLFGIEKKRGKAAKGDPYERFKPWDNPGAYQGAMDIESDGRTYRIERNFLATDKRLRVTDVTTGREIPLPGEFMEWFAPQISEAGFVNTVLAPQSGATTESALQSELSNYIANMSMAKNREVDVAGARATLAEQEKAFKARNEKVIAEEEQRLGRQLREDLTTMREMEALAETLASDKQELGALGEELLLIEKESGNDAETELNLRVSEYETYRTDRAEALEQAQAIVMLTERRNALQAELAKDSREQITKEREKRRAFERQAGELQQQWENDADECRMRARLAAERAGGKPMLLVLAVLFAIVSGIGGTMLLSVGIVFAVAAVVCAIGYVVTRRTAQTEARARIEEADRMEQTPPLLDELRETILQLPTEEELAERLAELAQKEGTLAEVEKQLAEDTEKQERVRGELAGREEELLSYFSGLMPMEALDYSVIRDLQGRMMARAAQNNMRRESANSRRDGLLRSVARAEASLEQMGDVEERITEAEVRLAEIATEKRANEIELRALALAKSTMEELSQEIHDSFGKELNTAASAMAAEMTDGAYHKLTADEKLQIKAARKSRSVSVESLSAGTAEQLYLALRMAVGRLMYKDYELPLIFDDSFVYYDDARLRNTLRLLAQENRQILLFTCQEREERLLKELGVDFSKVELA